MTLGLENKKKLMSKLCGFYVRKTLITSSVPFSTSLSLELSYCVAV